MENGPRMRSWSLAAILALLLPGAFLLVLGRCFPDGRFAFKGLRSAVVYEYLRWRGGSPEPWKGVIVGAGNWLYYPEELETSFPLEESRSLARNLRLLQSYFEAKGTRFLFFIAPDKHRIYPEHLPPGSEGRYPHLGQDLSPLLRALEEEGVAFLDLYAFLREAKARHPPERTLYTPGGTHWTPFATGLVAGEMFRRLGREWPRSQGPVTFAWSDDDDLVAKLHLLRKPRYRERVPAYPGPLAPLRSRADSVPARREWLFVGDSFLRVAIFSLLMDRPRPGLSTVGEDLQAAHSLRYVYGLSASIRLLDGREAYDRAVFGFVERALAEYAVRFRDLTILPDFDAVFHRADTVFRWDGMAAPGLRDAESVRDGKSLRVWPTGPDPAVAFPGFREGWGAAYHAWMRVEIDAGAEGEIGVAYRTAEGRRSEYARVPRGASLRHFRIPSGAREVEFLPAKIPGPAATPVTVRSLVVAQ